MAAALLSVIGTSPAAELSPAIGSPDSPAKQSGRVGTGTASVTRLGEPADRDLTQRRADNSSLPLRATDDGGQENADPSSRLYPVNAADGLDLLPVDAGASLAAWEAPAEPPTAGTAPAPAPAGVPEARPALEQASVATVATPNTLTASPDQFIGPVANPNLPPGPDARVSRLTALNRNSPAMSGGWNPALRGILVMADGSRWFAAESGTDTSTNSAMIYYRLGPTGWKAAGSVALPPGIQQNMATITDGRVIYSYGCTRGAVIETWFNTAKPRWNLSTGNAITAGGRAIDPGNNANYVGAAWHNKTRVVWWSDVGPGGAGGQWKYAYNSGRGWNGPVTGGLGGYNEVGYVRARFDSRSRLRLVGEGYLGSFPNGQTLLLASTVALGNAAQWAPVLTRYARTPLDIWRENDGTTHFLYRSTPGKIGYSFGTKANVPPTIFKAMDARFISDGDRLGLVLAYKRSIEVRLVPQSAAAGRIDWAAVPPITIQLPDALKAAGVSAIWTADDSRQPGQTGQLEFAVCGAYPARDNLIYYVTL